MKINTLEIYNSHNMPQLFLLGPIPDPLAWVSLKYAHSIKVLQLFLSDVKDSTADLLSLVFAVVYHCFQNLFKPWNIKNRVLFSEYQKIVLSSILNQARSTNWNMYVVKYYMVWNKK